MSEMVRQSLSVMHVAYTDNLLCVDHMLCMWSLVAAYTVGLHCVMIVLCVVCTLTVMCVCVCVCVCVFTTAPIISGSGLSTDLVPPQNVYPWLQSLMSGNLHMAEQKVRIF